MAPETLDKFRALTRKQGRQYTKVLERLAEAYIYTDGRILREPSTGPYEEDEMPATMSDLKEFQGHMRGVVESLDMRIQKLED